MAKEHAMRIKTLILASSLLAPLAAHADETTWQQNHPRRVQVNSRLQNQNARIRQGVRNGTLSGGQAAQLHQEHQEIRREERADAALHGSHITRQEQAELNRQENAESRQIYREKHPAPKPMVR
jgi:hypothetical protein